MKRVFITLCIVFVSMVTTPSHAREIESNGQEFTVRVTPGEPTQIDFPGVIQGGYKGKTTALSLDRNKEQLIVFAQQNISDRGEAILVRLDDGRTYSVRIQRATSEFPRDAVVTVRDSRDAVLPTDEEEAPYREKNFEYAPPTQVSGLVREMVLATEFGKAAISGYRVSERFKGQLVLDDGTMYAVVDKIFIGPNLWGYVIDAENRLDTTQKINPATFRLDGTRAISANNWELSARPLNAEQQIAGKHKAKVYIVTRAH